MEYDLHTTNKFTALKVFNIPHKFLVASDDFHLIEDSIIGLPFLKKYNYEINNRILYLNDFAIAFNLSRIIDLLSKLRTQHIETNYRETKKLYEFPVLRYPNFEKIFILQPTHPTKA